jgi:hypothetical protein
LKYLYIGRNTIKNEERCGMKEEEACSSLKEGYEE